MTMEPPLELQPVKSKTSASITAAKRTPSVSGRSLGSNNASKDHTSSQDQDRNESLPSPTTAPIDQAELWYKPRINFWRVMATFWAFTVMGMNDASYGPLIPYLEAYYEEPYSVIALVFLTPFAGYVAAALANNTVHMRFGQRGVAVIGPTCHILSYVVICVHPPYPVLAVAFILAGFGNGIEDAAYNAWIGAMANANELLGFLHGFYGLGATIAPLVATSMITKANLPWFYWYYVMIAAACVELATSAWSFWGASAAIYRENNARTSEAGGSRLKEATLKMPAARVTWCCALFLIGYVGIEVALGGWIVTFMINVRKAAPFASGMTATGFWMGITVGRLVLGFVTPKIGEKLAICVSPGPIFPLSSSYPYNPANLPTFRSTSPSPSPSSSSSGSSPNSTSAPWPSASSASSSAPSSPPPWSRAPSCCPSTCTSAASGSRRRLAGPGVPFSRMRLARSRRRRGSGCCSRLFWRCWL